MFSNFYKNKKVFITGHTGFKGSWLTLWLLELGANIKGYSLEPYTKNDHFVVTNLGSQVESIVADIRDLDKLQTEINNYKPEIVFHLAAQPLVRKSYSEPVLTYNTNIMGTVNILETVRNCDSIISFINVTSDKCYENIEKNNGYKEHEPMGGFDPYSSSKGCSELITSAYRRSFFNESNSKFIATARAGNVIGGGDWCQDRIMTDTIQALSTNEPILLRNPSATRPWQHVLEPLSGYLLLASKCNSDLKGGWNFGPNNSSTYSVKDVAELAIKAWGKGSWKDMSNSDNPHEAGLLNLDITKSKTQLQWSPLLNVEESVNYTVNWYRAFFDSDKKGPMFDYSLNQLHTYIKKAEKEKAVWN